MNELFLNFEPKYKTNDLKVFGDSGLILSANEHTKCGAFFIPSLGHAPEFCAFVENFTEELELKKKHENNEELKFVTHDELRALKAEKLIRTNKLQAHLHGFLMK